ncbi:MAG TPA: hypothetical protein VIA62_20605 [Thermoanaerobaculia bacterium]|jgi:hypothetical protein|nr:hypothetical protein [Thermoanaerobaculia bacterium]
MRELTRSMASFSWAMSLFGVEQMLNLASPRRAADAFGAVARAAGETLRPGAASAEGASQGLLSLAGDLAFRTLQLGVDTVYWTTGTAWQQQQGLTGWGSVQGTAPRR